MRTTKDFGVLESYHYYPEIKGCQHCGCELVRSHAVWSKVIISLSETACGHELGLSLRERFLPTNYLSLSFGR